MKYVYSPSYPSLRLICYFIQLGEEVTVISINPDIISLCHYMKWPVIPLEDCSHCLPRMREILNERKTRKYKKSLQERFEKVSSLCQEGTLYFTIQCIDIEGLDLIARFASERPDLHLTYWCEGDSDVPMKVLPATYREWAYLYYYNKLYKPRYCYRSGRDGKHVWAQEDFLKKYNIWVIAKPDIRKMDIYRGLSCSAIEAQYVIIGGYSLEESALFYNIEDLKNVYSSIKEVVPDVYYKPHPGVSELESFFDTYQMYPSYVPTEFMVNTTCVAIAAATTAMSYLAKAGVTCVSVLDLLRPEKGIDHAAWKKKMLEESDHKIIFVQSVEELTKILSNPPKQCAPC